MSNSAIQVNSKEFQGVGVVRFRRIASTDMDSVFKMICSSDVVQLPHWETKEFLLRAIEKQPEINIVAEHNSKIIGCVFVGDDGFRLVVHHLFVDERYRQHGIGRHLLEHLVEILVSYSDKNEAPRRLIGTFIRGNTFMRSLCQSLDFEIVEETLFQVDI